MIPSVLSPFAQLADRPVHGSDFGIAFDQGVTQRSFDFPACFIGSQSNLSLRIFLWQIPVELQVGLNPTVWFVRRSVPNDKEEGFVFLSVVFRYT